MTERRFRPFAGAMFVDGQFFTDQAAYEAYADGSISAEGQSDPDSVRHGLYPTKPGSSWYDVYRAGEHVERVNGLSAAQDKHPDLEVRDAR